MSKENGKVLELCSDYAEYINVYDGWIYYYHRGSGIDGFVYRIKPDGTNKQEIMQFNAYIEGLSGMQVYDGWIYYEQGDEINTILKRISFDGVMDNKAIQDRLWDSSIYNERLYFVNRDKGLLLYGKKLVILMYLI